MAPLRKRQRRLDLLLNKSRQRYAQALSRCRKSSSKGSIHDLRIALRTLISAVALTEKIVPSVRKTAGVKKLQKQLRRLGALRDTQVERKSVKEALGSYTELKAFAKHLRAREVELRERAMDELSRRGRKTKRYLHRLGEELRTIDRKEIPLSLVAPRIRQALFSAFREMRQAKLRAEHGGPKELHGLRVALKRYRYTIELLEPELLKMFAGQMSELRELQTGMGEIQDIEVLRRDLRGWAKQSPRRLAVARMYEKELERKENAALISIKKRIQSSRLLAHSVVRSVGR